MYLHVLPMMINRFTSMSIFPQGQCPLHILATGGSIPHIRDASGHTFSVECGRRDELLLTDCSLVDFKIIKRLINSVNGHSYRISTTGLNNRRSQRDRVDENTNVSHLVIGVFISRGDSLSVFIRPIFALSHLSILCTSLLRINRSNTL